MAPRVGNIYFIATTAVVGGGLFGFDISSMSAFIGEQPYACTFNTLGFNDDGTCRGPSADVQGGITAAMPGGSWLGSLFSGWLSDQYGRKIAIQTGCAIWILGSILCSAAQNIPMLIVGRLINGFCVGICSAQVPVYISEIAPPSKRGRLIAMQQWAITWGILIMFFICYGCSFIDSESSFRIPWGVQMFPAVLLGLALFLLPESPRWLAKQDRWEESLAVLALVHGRGDPDSPFVHQEMEEIRDVVEFERRNSNVSWLELFRPDMINRTMIGIFCQIWSQLTGMNVMMYYIVYIFNMAGIGSATLLSSGIDYIINVCMTVPALIWLDHWGRRGPLLVGAFLMCLWMCCNAGLFAVYSRTPFPGEFSSDAESMSISGAPAKAIIACTYLFVASYAPTWGPVSWTYPAELYPLRVRGKGVALATSANWAFNFALAYFVPPAFSNITWKTYVLFAVFCFAMFWHVFLLFPETANKTLEEVADLFDDTQPGAVRFLGQPAWTTRNERATVVRRERRGVGGGGDDDAEKKDAEMQLDGSNEHQESAGMVAANRPAAPKA